jgi:alpha/beta hydrolase fold
MMPKITVGDIDIHYQTQGSGQPLLMIMGLSFSLLDWGTELPALLAPNYQLILFDNRDAGLTSQSQRDYAIADMADDTAGLLDALKIPKARIFGVSMGGAIAITIPKPLVKNKGKHVTSCKCINSDRRSNPLRPHDCRNILLETTLHSRKIRL